MKWLLRQNRMRIDMPASMAGMMGGKGMMGCGGEMMDQNMRDRMHDMMGG